MSSSYKKPVIIQIPDSSRSSYYSSEASYDSSRTHSSYQSDYADRSDPYRPPELQYHSSMGKKNASGSTSGPFSGGYGSGYSNSDGSKVQRDAYASSTTQQNQYYSTDPRDRPVVHQNGGRTQDRPRTKYDDGSYFQ